MKDRIDGRLRTTQASARLRLAEAVQNASCEMQAVRSQERTEPVESFLRLSAETDDTVDSALAVLPGSET